MQAGWETPVPCALSPPKERSNGGQAGGGGSALWPEGPWQEFPCWCQAWTIWVWRDYSKETHLDVEDNSSAEAGYMTFWRLYPPGSGLLRQRSSWAGGAALQAQPQEGFHVNALYLWQKGGHRVSSASWLFFFLFTELPTMHAGNPYTRAQEAKGTMVMTPHTCRVFWNLKNHLTHSQFEPDNK